MFVIHLIIKDVDIIVYIYVIILEEYTYFSLSYYIIYQSIIYLNTYIHYTILNDFMIIIKLSVKCK